MSRMLYVSLATLVIGKVADFSVRYAFVLIGVQVILFTFLLRPDKFSLNEE
jgi:hypothetical protein